MTEQDSRLADPLARAWPRQHQREERHHQVEIAQITTHPDGE